MFCHQVTKATQRSLQQKTVDFTPESDIEWNPKKKKERMKSRGQVWSILTRQTTLILPLKTPQAEFEIKIY